MAARRHAIRDFLALHPMATAVLYVMTGVLPLYLTSTQIASLEAELGFSAARLGIATATYFGVGALASPIAGRAVARRSATHGLQVGSVVAGASAVTAALAGSWEVLPVVAALAGIANSFMQVGSNMVLVNVARFERQGMGFGAKQGAIPLASMVAGFALPIIGLAVGWRWTFVMAAMVAVGALLVAPPIPDRPKSPAPLAVATGQRVPRALLWLAVGGACGGAAGNAVSLFVVPSALDAGIAEAVAGTLLAICSGLVVMIRIGSGWLADRRRSAGHREMAWLLALGAIGCAVLATASTVPAYLAAMPLAMMGAWGWPGLVYFTVTSTNADNPARASGVVLAGNLTGTFVGPLVVGLLAEQHRYTMAWSFCALLSLAAMTAMMLSARAWHRTTMPAPNAA
ncbi:MAG: MFS transporter [Acidimicrobiia bacterium]|nr:MFS transporter [Acidimicrobiia bacterium]MDH4306438.1 MFS transporter [Acidimicrobiia bacterium]MDH5292645.1 MFS transporter [Acidimicrobiia bacterium]